MTIPHREKASPLKVMGRVWEGGKVSTAHPKTQQALLAQVQSGLGPEAHREPRRVCASEAQDQDALGGL